MLLCYVKISQQYACLIVISVTTCKAATICDVTILNPAYNVLIVQLSISPNLAQQHLFQSLKIYRHLLKCLEPSKVFQVFIGQNLYVIIAF